MGRRIINTKLIARNIFFFFLETGSRSVTQAGLQAHCSLDLLGSSDPPASASQSAEITAPSLSALLYLLSHVILPLPRRIGGSGVQSQLVGAHESQLCPFLPNSMSSEIGGDQPQWEYLPMEISKSYKSEPF